MPITWGRSSGRVGDLPTFINFLAPPDAEGFQAIQEHTAHEGLPQHGVSKPSKASISKRDGGSRV